MEEEKRFDKGDYRSIQQIDPSSLTTQLVIREISSLKELLINRIEAIEKAVEIAHNNLVRVPTDVEKEVNNLKSLHEERFSSMIQRFLDINQRFGDLADLRNEKFSALQNQINMQEKLVTQQYDFLVESITKSDNGLIKIIDQQALLIVNTTRATDDKVDDLKKGIAKLDSLIIGLLGQSAGRKDFWGYLIGGAGLIGTVIAIVGYFIIHK